MPQIEILEMMEVVVLAHKLLSIEKVSREKNKNTKQIIALKFQDHIFFSVTMFPFSEYF